MQEKSKFEQLTALVKSLEGDFIKAYKGQGAAGRRVRKGMQEVKSLCQEIRFEISELKNK